MAARLSIAKAPPEPPFYASKQDVCALPKNALSILTWSLLWKPLSDSLSSVFPQSNLETGTLLSWKAWESLDARVNSCRRRFWSWTLQSKTAHFVSKLRSCFRAKVTASMNSRKTWLCSNPWRLFSLLDPVYGGHKLFASGYQIGLPLLACTRERLPLDSSNIAVSTLQPPLSTRNFCFLWVF